MQPSQHHVAPCVKGVEWGLGIRFPIPVPNGNPRIPGFFSLENSQDLFEIIVIIHLARALLLLIHIYVRYTTPNKYKSYIRLYKPL